MYCELASRWLTVFAALAACVAGCTAEAHNYIRFPSSDDPGPAAYQRAQAIQHDPYPLNDVGAELLAADRCLSAVDHRAGPGENGSAASRGNSTGAAAGNHGHGPPVASSPFAVAPPQAGVPLTPSPYATTSSFAPPASAGDDHFRARVPGRYSAVSGNACAVVVSPYPATPAASAR